MLFKDFSSLNYITLQTAATDLHWSHHCHSWWQDPAPVLCIDGVQKLTVSFQSNGVSNNGRYFYARNTAWWCACIIHISIHWTSSVKVEVCTVLLLNTVIQMKCLFSEHVKSL